MRRSAPTGIERSPARNRSTIVRFDDPVAQLERGHAQLHTLADEVRAAAEAHDLDTMRDALVAFDRALVAHLRLEEDIVIPRLLELQPEEFLRYYHSSVSTLRAQLDCAPGGCG